MAAPPRPRLVPVDPQRSADGDGEELVVLRDPAGIARDGLGLSRAAFWIAAQLDGTRTVEDVVALATGQGVTFAPDEVSALVDGLDAAGFVEGPRRRALRGEALAAFRASGLRPPSCAGGVYPGQPDALRAALDRWLAAPGGPPPGTPPPAPLRLLVAPHIDYRRGAVGYAHAYRALAGADAELFVVFGTAHASPRRLFTLTRLDHDTPLGPVPTDRPAVEALAAALGEAECFEDELCHRDEHSVELQVVLLRHLVRRPFTVLPVLCSSLAHLDDPAGATAPFLDALDRALAGRRACFVAGADLAHVGPLYGDDRPATPAERAALAEADLRTLGYLARGDAEGFHRDALRDGDRRRICGVAPIYAALRASRTGARLLHHGTWTDGTDLVSYAAAAG
ncbi:MAG: AmmeMemoRadiSam system protein B [Anaeromyxobacter sp.]